MERQGTRERRGTDQLVERVVPTDVLTRPEEASGGVEEARCVQPAGGIERLLGGAIPDTPITVEAKLPDEPTKPLRERMRVTREAFCWKCHQRMDSLGLPFEMFDGWGRHRTTELGKPVDTTGAIVLSADPALEGAVDDAVKMLHKLAKSEHVEQVFVRHAFRFWLGRNETPEDAPTLQAAHRAYRDNGGSMRAMVTSLLTSDSFLYRIPARAEARGDGKK